MVPTINPTSLIEHINVRLLLANAPNVVVEKVILSYKTFVFFKNFSILEENCGADIINVRFLNVTFLLTDSPKHVVG